MTMHTVNSSSTFRYILLIAIIVACSLLGDSFLYIALPLEFKSLGLNLPSVGVLLSVNRIVRFFSNTWAGYIYGKYSIRLPLIMAISIGSIITLSYGMIYGFLPFLIARIIWGIVWSFLRLPGCILISEISKRKRGRIMMRASITRLARVMPEGTYYKTLKARVEAVNGDTNELLWDLAIHRYTLQKVIDALWELDRIPKKS